MVVAFTLTFAPATPPTIIRMLVWICADLLISKRFRRLQELESYLPMSFFFGEEAVDSEQSVALPQAPHCRMQGKELSKFLAA